MPKAPERPCPPYRKYLRHPAGVRRISSKRVSRRHTSLSLVPVRHHLVGISELLKGRQVTLYCHDSKNAVGYIGEDEAVRDAISHQDSLENPVSDPGYAGFSDHPNLKSATLAPAWSWAGAGGPDLRVRQRIAASRVGAGGSESPTAAAPSRRALSRLSRDRRRGLLGIMAVDACRAEPPREDTSMV